VSDERLTSLRQTSMISYERLTSSNQIFIIRWRILN